MTQNLKFIPVILFTLFLLQSHTSTAQSRTSNAVLSPQTLSPIDISSLANAILAPDTSQFFTSAAFTGADVQTHVFTQGLQGFPTNGNSFLVLSSGVASQAPGTASTFVSNTVGGGTGVSPDGFNALDVATLTLTLNVPNDAQMLSFGFKFGTEENPTFLNSVFQDFFTAKINGSTNIALLPNNDTVTVDNADPFSNDITGDSTLPTGEFPSPNDVVYNAVLRNTQTASFNLTPFRGQTITIAFQIGDAFDSALDSAAFIDNLRIERGGCTPVDPNVLANTPLALADGSMTTLQQSPLAGLAPVFIDLGCKHHVDPRLMVAIAAHESLLGLGLPGTRHVNPPSQATTTDDGFFADGLGRQWQWKAGTKFCGKFNPFGLLHPDATTTFDCVDPPNDLGVAQPVLKFDRYTLSIEYLAEHLAVDWLYFKGDGGCPGFQTTVSGIANNAGASCGYPRSEEELGWAANVTIFFQDLGGDPNDVRNPRGFTQPRPERIKLVFRKIDDPSDILITDPIGRRVGFNVQTQQIINEIPEAVFSGRGTSPAKIDIVDPLDGTYMVTLTGTSDSPYFVKLFAQNVTGTFSRLTVAGDISKGETIKIPTQYSKEGGSFLPINVRVDPRTFNTKSRGVFTARAMIPAGLEISLSDINTSTIRLQGIAPVRTQIANKKQLVATFNRRDFIALSSGKAQKLTLTAALKDGTLIRGSDTARIIHTTFFNQFSAGLASLFTTLSRSIGTFFGF
ncbi:MAG: hypothetical protein A2945_01220 [Candidatus Liptonbacteria bacterium RIFCSPLOWO2_01_FULL_52_25]|uniref:Uncharacterized protein n=1 Tax=Candidatus Liptonbacteria bacterium RIFCSPLOWO2_01_FULL_52_25 TaxID=1798650 RepID=A0A1G2CFN3_9BACT|nr:MAG: hypothetical protein A2945_01220 [Candidatus Liptonbacteria bacterium RIFCSPLOWO2_01_FULL_52_25]